MSNENLYPDFIQLLGEAQKASHDVDNYDVNLNPETIKEYDRLVKIQNEKFLQLIDLVSHNHEKLRREISN